MSCHLLASHSACTFIRLQSRSYSSIASFSNGFSPSPVRLRAPAVAAAATKMCATQIIKRRSANYQPPKWGYDYVQSLTTDYVEESYAKQLSKLKEDVRLIMLDINKANTEADALRYQQLELIDTLQRLGISYHFQDEIASILNTIYINSNRSSYHCYDDKQKQESLLTAALEFRLLRQHGYHIPAETLFCFMDEKGNFKSSCLGDDCKAILALYEASYLLLEEESSIFNEAINFTTTYLKEYVQQINKDEYISTLVNHALEIPLHWRMLRLEARWFMDLYESAPNSNPILLELAKLDFNIVQAIHQDDLKSMSRWWKKMGLGEKLRFSRDRLMESFFWTVGVIFEPQYGHVRRTLTKINQLVTTIDDVYDIYGTIDELELFTDAIDRWDASAMEQLPSYMKLCFLALYNTVNEMAYEVLKQQGIDIIPYLKKAWAGLCKLYLIEAKWFSSGYIPTLQEYMDNAWVSISGPLVLTHAYISHASPITVDALEYIQEYPHVIRWASIILRLADDLGTSSEEMKRGDVAKSIQCYMHQTGASEEEARDHIRELIAETWMKMNRDRHENPHLSKAFIETAMNLGRMAQCMYQHGDGHASQDHNIVGRIMSLLINPIPLSNRSELQLNV